ncbi:3771_t:CDS:2, partial [Paraglomus occultum]
KEENEEAQSREDENEAPSDKNPPRDRLISLSKSGRPIQVTEAEKANDGLLLMGNMRHLNPYRSRRNKDHASVTLRDLNRWWSIEVHTSDVTCKRGKLGCKIPRKAKRSQPPKEQILMASPKSHDPISNFGILNHAPRLKDARSIVDYLMYRQSKGRFLIQIQHMVCLECLS